MTSLNIVDLADTVGKTPLVRLTGVCGVGDRVAAEIVGKLEFMNPGGSIKDRVAKHIVAQLDARGVPRDALLIVAGPGNLAISLAMLQRRLMCLIPERTSADRVRLLKAAGVTDIVRTLDGALPGNYGSTLLDDDWMLAHDLLDSRMLDELQKKQLDQYRAASIEDLQLPAAVTVSEQESMGAAINLMAENDFSQVPVTGSGRRLIGYLTLSAAQTMIDNGTATRSMPVRQFMLRFAGRATRKPSTEQHGSGGVAANTSICKQYWLITPETPLSELARFFETHSVAFVTDASRKFCLGIATKQDLLTFLARRHTLQF
ncbi:hypothetical protein H4R26_003253 [Coemansia thaxteri]|uniref:CBS domain-containing protein n=1 Tax=Coemansia thaxteri TaxID=2663907 RepID=A0A9W8EF68_9FUNG|nr:hypothetical protein H4R26_003253 [Coemansia thaxteri]